MIGGKLAANGANHGQLRPLAAVRLDLFAHGKKRRTSVVIHRKTGQTSFPMER